MKNIFLQLKNRSNIDYYYYHLFNNKLLKLDYRVNNFTINYIIYIINSDFSVFLKKYEEIKTEAITDIFLERLILSENDKINLFNMRFKNLFWLKLNNIVLKENDYLNLVNFLDLNSLDINRIFFENLDLFDNFFQEFKKLNGFGNLSFLNFDNNNFSDIGINNLVSFLDKNRINLEYLSLIGNNINNCKNILDYINKKCSNIRILDLSNNNILDKKNIIKFLENNKKIKELFLRNIKFSNLELEKMYNIFEKQKTNIYILRFSLLESQKKILEKFKNLEKKNNIYFDIDFLKEKKEKMYSTIYLKQTNDISLKSIENDYFYVLEENNLEYDFNLVINQKQAFLKNGINLFLFDFHDYKMIDYLLRNYSFNYIYIENYFISEEDFIYFIESIRNKKNKKYKINFISIEITEVQLDYLINNFPDNIFYIEINLNKIYKNREKYIFKILKNKAFIFENMELYNKIFK